MSFAWTTKTMFLPDHKVAITKQSQDWGLKTVKLFQKLNYQGRNYVLQSKDLYYLKKNKLEFIIA